MGPLTAGLPACIGCAQGLVQGRHIRGRNQGILRPANAQEPACHPSHLVQGGRATPGSSTGHPGAVEVTGGGNPSKAGGQQGDMTAKAKAKATDRCPRGPGGPQGALQPTPGLVQIP